MSYKSLNEKSRYLKIILTGGKNKNLRSEEITECQDYADNYIEGKLGKSWETADIPVIIEHIADLLGSAKAYKFILTGQTPKEGDYSKSLQAEADKLLTQIKNGELGLKLPDGSWDTDYPGDKNKEEKEPSSMEILA